MKKIYILLAMVMAAMTASAQYEVGTWTVTPKIGMNVSSVTEGDVYYQTLDGLPDGPLDPKMRLGFVVGAEGEYQVHKMIGLSAGLIYSQQGMKYKHTSEPTSTTTLAYLNLPMLANFYVAHGLALKLGVQLSYALGLHGAGESQFFAKGSTYTDFIKNKFGGNPITSSSDWYRPFDVSIPIGVSYDINDLFRVDLRYNFGLLDVSKEGLKQHNRVIQLTVGYRFELPF